MPIERETQEEKRLTVITQIDGVSLYRVRDLGREAILLRGDKPTAIEGAMRSYLDALEKILLLNEEPMMNIAGFYGEGIWRLVIFLRRKHRPDVFFMEGDARMVVSPGVIDMGGVLITPIQKDFDRLDAPTVEGIYREVSLDGKVVERAVEVMR